MNNSKIKDHALSTTATDEIDALRRQLAEVTEELEETKCSNIDLELQLERSINEFEVKIFEKSETAKKVLAQLANAKDDAKNERRLNEQLQKDKEGVEDQVEEYKKVVEQLKRRIVELEIETEQATHNERIWQDRVKLMEEAQMDDMDKISDLETRLIELEQRTRDGQVIILQSNNPPPISPNINLSKEKEQFHKKEENRNAVNVIDDVIKIIEKFEKILYKDENPKK